MTTSNRLSMLATACCCIAKQSQAQQAQVQVQVQHHGLPPIPKVDPLNDGIFLRSILLPDIPADGTAESSGGVNRERLIMYDFRPALPPYSAESLGELLLFPKREIEIEKQETGTMEEAIEEGDDEHNDAMEHELQEEEGQVQLDGEVESGSSQPIENSESSAISTNETAILSEQASSNGDDDKGASVEETSSSSGESTEDQSIESSDDTQPGSNGEELDGEVIQTGETISEETKEEVEKDAEIADVTLEQEVDVASPVQDDGSSNNAMTVEEGIDDSTTAIPADGADNDAESNSIPATDGSDTEEDSTIKAESEEGGAQDIVQEEESSHVREDGIGDAEKETMDDSEENTSFSEEAGAEDDVMPDVDSTVDVPGKNKVDEPSEMVVTTEEEASPPATGTEFDSEQATATRVNEDAAAENESDSSDTTTETAQEESLVTTEDDNDDQSEQKITIQYDDELPPPSSVYNKEANRQFVTGLDEIDKLFESVEVPDELDVGADGSSMQDVLVGQGLKIVWKRTKNSFGSFFGKDIREKIDGVRDGFRGVWKLLDMGDGEDEEEDLVINLSRLKEEAAGASAGVGGVDRGDGGESSIEKTKKGIDTKDDDVAQTQQAEKKEEGAGAPSNKKQDGNKTTKDKDKDQHKKSSKKESPFPLIKSPKAQKLWKFARRKWEQAKHILDDLFSIFDGTDDEDYEDNDADFDLEKIQQELGKNKAALKGAGGTMPNFDGKFGSEVDESFLKSRYEAMIKQQGQQQQQ